MPADTQLDTLEARGLIRLAAYMPELEYLFRHWLVQDAAYGSLLKQERRELHGRVGDALERLYPERTGELAAVLGMHFEQAGETNKALDYLVAAGRYALERNAIEEAFSAFDRAAQLLPPSSDAEDEAMLRRRVEIELGRVRASWSFRPIEDLLADLEAAVPRAERLADLDLLAQLHVHAGLARLQLGESASSPGVKRALDRVAEIGQILGDPSLQAMPLALTGLTKVFVGPIREGVAALEHAVPLLETRHDLIAAAFARGALAIGYAELGEFEKAEEAASHASSLANSGDLIAKLDAQIAESILRAARGQLDAAMPLALACVNQAEQTGATACVVASSWVLGDVYDRLGRFDDAQQILIRGNEVAAVVDRKVWRPTLQAWLGSTVAALGQAHGGNWDEALETARSIGNRVGEAGILWKRAEAASRRGDWNAALQDFAASAAIYESEGARPNLARVLRGWGETLRAAGREREAEAPLRRSLALFEELGIAPEAQAVRRALGG